MWMSWHHIIKNNNLQIKRTKTIQAKGTILQNKDRDDEEDWTSCHQMKSPKKKTASTIKTKTSFITSKQIELEKYDKRNDKLHDMFFSEALQYQC